MVPKTEDHMLHNEKHEDEIAAWVAWAAVTALLPIERRALREHFGSMAEAWAANEAALRQALVRPAAVSAAVNQRHTILPQQLLAQVNAAGVRICRAVDPDYPPLLARIHDPPMTLFYRGRLETPAPAVAIVGTRRASDYGNQVAWELAQQLAAAGVTIVSGLAYGIDGTAHRAVISAGGKTCAVLGGGVDAACVYPPAHRTLAEHIIEKGGVVLSEYPPGTPPLPRNFLQRNRIIAGLAQGTVVVEAPVPSGALVTARISAEENRDVFAVPGRITDPNSAGVNSLIAQGATLVQNAADVLAALGISVPRQTAAKDLGDETASAIFSLLTEPRSLEELQRLSGLAAGVVAVAVTRLEVRGWLRRLPNGKLHRTSAVRPVS